MTLATITIEYMDMEERFNMEKLVKVNDKELEKLRKLLGDYQVKMLFATNKLQLSSKQLDILCGTNAKSEPKTKENCKESA